MTIAEFKERVKNLHEKDANGNDYHILVWDDRSWRNDRIVDVKFEDDYNNTNSITWDTNYKVMVLHF